MQQSARPLWQVDKVLTVRKRNADRVAITGFITLVTTLLDNRRKF